jgi:hypothetical protein
MALTMRPPVLALRRADAPFAIHILALHDITNPIMTTIALAKPLLRSAVVELHKMGPSLESMLLALLRTYAAFAVHVLALASRMAAGAWATPLLRRTVVEFDLVVMTKNPLVLALLRIDAAFAVRILTLASAKVRVELRMVYAVVALPIPLLQCTVVELDSGFLSFCSLPMVLTLLRADAALAVHILALAGVFRWLRRLR